MAEATQSKAASGIWVNTAFLAVLIGFLIGGSVVLIEERGQAIVHAEEELVAGTRVLEANVLTALTEAETLVGIYGRLKSDADRSMAAFVDRIAPQMDAVIADLPAIKQMVLTDAAGVIAHAQNPRLIGISMGDSVLYRVHEVTGGSMLSFGAITTLPEDGAQVPVLPASWPMRDSVGRLLGVIIVYIDLEVVAGQFMTAVAHTDRLAAWYRSGTGTVVVATAEGAVTNGSVQLIDPPRFAALGATVHVGPLAGRGGPWLIAGAPLDEFGSVVALAVPRTDALTEWREYAVRWIVGSLIAVAVCGGFAGVALTATAGRRHLAEDAADRARLLRVAETTARTGFFVIENDTNRVRLSDGAREVLGLRAAQVGLNELFARLAPVDGPRLAEAINRARQDPDACFELEVALKLGTAETEHLRIRAEPELDRVNRPVGILGTVFDLTEQKKLADSLLAAEARFRDVSPIDDVTGLPTRRYFLDRAKHEALRGARYQQPIAFLAIDLDDFKTVNQVHGRQIGEEAIKRFTGAMQDALRETDIMGRLGGEEFGVILPNATVPGARQLGRRLCRLAEAVHVPSDAGKVVLTLSIGVALQRPGETNPRDIMRRADSAMYQAKAEGRNRVLFDPVDEARDDENTVPLHPADEAKTAEG